MADALSSDAPAFGVLLALGWSRWPLAAVKAARWRPLLIAAGLTGVALVGAMDVRWQHGAGYTLAYLAAGALVLAAATARASPSAPIAVPAFAFLGRISYPLYVWHASIGAVIRALLPASPALALLASLAGSVAMAWIMHTAVERPFLRWRDRRPAAGRAGPKQLIATANALH